MTQLLNQFIHGISDMIPKDETLELLQAHTHLTVKWGADPSSTDLHLGHLVILHKLRLLQKMGFSIIFLIGDFTAMIGDPTGKSKTRPPLSLDEGKANAKTYQTQVFKILDEAKTRVVYNSEWLSTLSLKEMISLASKCTVARMLEREDFHKRYTSHGAISIHEFLYPLLQGYDSVHLRNHIEIGGTDQTFNLLMGRTLQAEYGQKPQCVITLPILEGTDGVQKMSKSLGNHIGIMEDPFSMFGKLMSIPDTLIVRYLTLLTDFEVGKIQEWHQKMARQEINPKEVKEILACDIVKQLHSQTAANEALENFKRVFSDKQNPLNMDVVKIESEDETRLDVFCVTHHLIASKKEIQRLISEGAVELDGVRIPDIFYQWKPQVGQVLKIGKRRFYRLG